MHAKACVKHHPGHMPLVSALLLRQPVHQTCMECCHSMLDAGGCMLQPPSLALCFILTC
eukprot:CAMPEP_0202915160 /NCGR_PEP_ID=MMETSP1392-20130828/64971_1 /ASSEMBLY_ACC=CAM_ASM_000868 /TAXON_ID=225041 /ORGANISM="Chlamydomonas chlamydogama, Strain SAG 11-48b" /LENGTH=58 /DNA_ID=CAMNT_0049607075 /DNA_START=434 /DNA_END=610 /DNA_ORIENTATION=-